MPSISIAVVSSGEVPEPSPSPPLSSAPASKAGSGAGNGLLQLYWDLASRKADQRLQASMSLLTALSGQLAERDGDDPGATVSKVSGAVPIAPETASPSVFVSTAVALTTEAELDARCPPDVAYAVKRLVRGLPSSRDGARQGFATCLTELLRMLPVSTTLLLDLLDKATLIPASARGQDERDMFFGRVFGVQAVVRAQLLSRPSTSPADMDRVVEGLLGWAAKKSYLREACYKILAEIHQSTPIDPKYIPAVLESPQDLHLMLITSGPLPSDDLVVSAVKEAATVIPHFHSCLPALLQKLLKSDKLMGVWPTISNTLFNGTLNYKYMGFLLIQHLFNHSLVAPSHITLLLTGEFIRTLINHLADSDNYLNKIAKQTCGTMVKACEARRELAFPTYMAITTKSTKDFDRITKTTTLARLVTELDESGSQAYASYLKPIVSEKEAREREWAIESLLGLVRNKRIPKSGDLDSEIIQFLATKIFEFESYNFLNRLVSLPNISATLPTLIMTTKSIPCPTDAHKQIIQILSLTATIPKQMAMKNLLSGVFLLSFIPDMDLQQDMEELCKIYADMFCATESVKPKKRKAESIAAPMPSDNESSPTPTSILLDLLISFLSKPCASLRTCSEDCWRVFCGDAGADVFAAIIEVLNGEGVEKKEDEEDTEIVFKDDDESDVDVDVHDKASSDEEGEDEDDSDGETVGDGDLNLRVKLEQAVKASGMAVEGGDDEDVHVQVEMTSDSESEKADLGDDDMLAFDEKIAEIFRIRKMAKKAAGEIKTQMMHFRIRILDLLIIFASQNPASPHLQKLMVPLFTILSSRQKTDDFRTKSLTMLNKIIKGKEVVSGSKKEAIESLATVHELLRERADSKLNEIGVLVCAYLVKCVLNAQSEPVSKKAKKEQPVTTLESIYAASMTDYLTNKNTRMRDIIFLDFMSRHFELSTEIFLPLLESSRNPITTKKWFNFKKAWTITNALVKLLPKKDSSEKILVSLSSLTASCLTELDFMLKDCCDTSKTLTKKVKLDSSKLKEILKLVMIILRKCSATLGVDSFKKLTANYNFKSAFMDAGKALEVKPGMMSTLVSYSNLF